MIVNLFMRDSSMAMEKEVIDIEHHFLSFKKIIGDDETFCLLELGLRKQY